ncbi:hypothetical protein JTB14_023421 [Gonioctena quinquepunctata]|nr:hypothetical protein JTB14_023421 [Gonioctena quinquepunctata]
MPKKKTVVASIEALEQKVTEIRATLTATPVINPEPPGMGYANALKKPPAQIRVNQGRPIKTSVNQVILIHPAPENNEIETAEDTLEAIKKVSPASVGVKPIKIINLPDKGIEIISADTNLNKAALDKLGLTAKVVDKGFPRIAITGFPENLTAQKVQDEVNMNLALAEGDPEEVRALHRYGTKHGTCTWVVEAPPRSRMRLIDKGVTTIEWSRCWVRDHVRIIRCSKYQRFGHMAAACKSEKACADCAGTHETRNCPKEARLRCANYERSREEDTEHSAGNPTCPNYRRRLHTKKSRTATLEIRQVAEDLRLDVLLVQEPYAYEDRDKKWRIPGSASYRIAADTTNRPLAGIIIMNKGTDAMQLKLTNTQHIVAITYKSHKYHTSLLTSIYWNPDKDMIEEVENLVSAHARKQILIGGDFNAKSELWYANSQCNRGLAMEGLLLSTGLHLMNLPNQPETHSTANGVANIDLTLADVNTASTPYVWKVLPDKVQSDHRLIITEVGSEESSKGSQNQNKYSMKHLNLDMINPMGPRYEEEFASRTVETEADIDSAITDLTTALLEITECSKENEVIR